MKTLIALLMLVTVTGWAQLPLNKETGLYTYEEVIDQDGSKEELQARAREWFTHAFKNADGGVQINDGQVTGTGKFSIYLSMNTRQVKHTVTIEVKDNKYRYVITHFIVDWGNGVATDPFESVQKAFRSKLYNTTADTMPEIIASLKKQMSTEKAGW